MPEMPIKDVSSDEDVIMNLCWENKLLKDEIKHLKDLLCEWDDLIRHQYHGSREAMSDLMHIAQKTAHVLNKLPPKL